MSKIIALLRAINVGGVKVNIAELRAMVSDLGFADVKSYIASGNLVFDGDGRSCAELEALFETEATKQLGLTTEWMCRTAEEWKTILAANPYEEFAKESPSKLLVTLFKTTPDPKGLETVRAKAVFGETMNLVGRELFVTFPEGAGKSKLGSAAAWKPLKSPGTSRNWNTMVKLGEMAGV
jgi:uncharacterized protein (DUF1697 family)